MTDPTPPEAHPEVPQKAPTAVSAAVQTSASARPERSLIARLIAPWASLRLTVWLMLAAIGLIFFGTLAQTQQGIWAVMEQYFRSWFVLVPLDLLFPAKYEVPGVLPWPGGATLGLLLLVNLLAAHAVRFKLHARGARLGAGLAVTAVGAALVGVAFLVPSVANALSTRGIVFLFAVGSLFFIPLLVGTWLLFGRRAGITLIHASLILLIVGEGITALTARESQMPIYEGQTTAWSHDIREVELAILRPAHPEKSGEADADADTDAHADTNLERVWAIRERALESAAHTGDPIRIDGLPFAVRVDRWMPNSVIGQRPPGSPAPGSPTPGGFGSPDTPSAPDMPVQATIGVGVDQVVARKVPAVSGVGEQRVNQPSALVSFVAPGGGAGGEASLGRMLVSSWLETPGQAFSPLRQTLKTPAGDFDIVMRFKRDYKPYRVELTEFRHDLYPGTGIPKNFSSQIILRDPAAGTERSVLIRMNEPLRYRGETFFQSGWIPDDAGGADRGTVLQVVDNPGWTVPYIAVIVGGLGLTLHFVLALVKFLRQRRVQMQRDTGRNRPKAGAAADHAKPNPWPVRVATAAALVLAVAALMPRPAKHEATAGGSAGFDVARFGQLAVSYGGRFKPWDSVARDTLTAISGKQSLQRGGEKAPAVAWLLDAITRRPAAADDRVFRIDHSDVKSLIGVADFDRKRFGYAEIEPHFDELRKQIEAATATDEKSRSAFERQLLELGDHIAEFHAVALLTGPHVVPPVETAAGPRTESGINAAGASGNADWSPLPDALTTPPEPSPSTTAPDAAGTTTATPPTEAALYSQAFSAYAGGDSATFNTSVSELHRLQQQRFPTLARKAQIEADFNAFDPFTRCIVLYIAAGLLVLASWIFAPGPLLRAALVLLVTAAVVHTLGLGVRVYLSGRPPVTNLYGSAVFIGWAIVLLGLLLEPLTKLGLGYLVAALAGVSTLLIARGLDEGDTMAVLQAVLDTNFWLATHVIVITLGYAAMFVAGLLGAVYLVGGVYTPLLRNAERARRLTGAIYGTVCFALLLSFVGTILGGIWADQSWGRFWGWDPKENGAMIIVLWCAVTLHAKLGHMVRQRGLAAMAVAGNLVTVWSWFGVNMLGVGLHSYGFMDSAFFWILLAVAVHLAILSAAAIPTRRWASFTR